MFFISTGRVRKSVLDCLLDAVEFNPSMLNITTQEARRPLILIGHSLGGLVIKQV